MIALDVDIVLNVVLGQELAAARVASARELVAAAVAEHPTAGGRTALRLALVELDRLTKETT